MESLDAASLSEEALGLWGADAVRLAGPPDHVGGARPSIVLEPASVDVVPAMLQWADSKRLAVVPRGGGTKRSWGAPGRADAVLSMARLTMPIEHRAGDLTATLPAGATLLSVNRLLAVRGQWLALDPHAGGASTIGGIVATNDSGPRRQRYGTPRDLIIGVNMALVDGRSAKSGGRVVKNVAGYDLSRLLCGSFGSLAVITQATFKLSPIAPASRTLVAPVRSARQLGEFALALSASPLVPSAVELEFPPGRLLVRFESVPQSAEQQAATATALAAEHGIVSSMIDGLEETVAWRAYGSRVWREPGTLLKIAVLPTEVGATINTITQAAERYEVECAIAGHAALGLLWLRVSGASGAQRTLIQELRQHATTRQGSLVVLEADDDLKTDVDAWGPIGDGLSIMRAIKTRFDPNGTLNPGRAPGAL